MWKIISVLIVSFSVNFLAYSQDVQQEVVYLKNGNIIRGTVVEQIIGQSLKIQTADGSIFVYRIDEVEKIMKENATQAKRTVSSVPMNDITGYRGFVDIGYTEGLRDSGANRLELTTSHGYQFNPYFFTGMGIGVHYYMSMWRDDINVPFIPLFLDLRGNLMKGPIVPFVGMKLGYTLIIDDGILGSGVYIAPSAGVKYVLSESLALNMSLGYSMQIDEGSNIGGFSIKMGIEF